MKRIAIGALAVAMSFSFAVGQDKVPSEKPAEPKAVEKTVEKAEKAENSGENSAVKPSDQAGVKVVEKSKDDGCADMTGCCGGGKSSKGMKAQKASKETKGVKGASASKDLSKSKEPAQKTAKAD
jgi:hypothetical protein